MVVENNNNNMAKTRDLAGAARRKVKTSLRDKVMKAVSGAGKKIYKAGETMEMIKQTKKNNRKSRKNVKKIVGKKFEGMSQSPQSKAKYDYAVKKENKKRGL